ncbi:MAG: sugar phosphate isomerase/epimerase [Clostridia bacterium]|nr:sugar phosphate isomerase/epimerase [Clostridia bacterium]
MKRRVGISTNFLQKRFGDIEALKIAKSVGADAVDFSTILPHHDYRKDDSIYAKSDDEIYTYYRGLKKLADDLGLDICQTHGRISGFKNIESEDDALIENMRRDCIACKALEAEYCVVHSTTTIHLGPDAPKALMHSLNFDLFNRCIAEAKKYGVIIASETFGDADRYKCCDFFGNIDEFERSYRDVSSVGDNSKYMAICMDTGHSNKAMRFNNNPTPADVIRRLGGDIKVLHLNDNDTLTDQHKIPLTGCIDWVDVFDALDEIGYDGVYNMELNLGIIGGKGLEIESADYAVKVMRNLLKNRYGE